MTTAEQTNSYSVVDVALDVSDALPFEEKCSIAGTLFVPDDLDDRPTVVVATPGASINRKYFDICLPNGTDYSQARHFAERGFVFAALDYLGGGDSSKPNGGEVITLPMVAAASHQAILELTAGLRDGSLAGKAIEPGRLIGYGFSFGGDIYIVQQAEYEDFAAVIIAGSTPIAPDAIQHTPEGWDDFSVEEKRAAILASNEAIVGEPLPIYHGIPRTGLWEGFYPESASEELVRYEIEELQTLVPRTATVDAMLPGFEMSYAAKITAPIFLAFGDNDLISDTHIQPTAYPACSNLMLTTYPDTTHLHNLCEGRTSMWDRSIAWLDYIKVDAGPER